MKYDVDYFINKFENIPDDKWTTGRFLKSNGTSCVFGHCGSRYDILNKPVMTDEALQLSSFIGNIMGINDNKNINYPQPTPKARILAALRDKKEGKI